MARISRLVLVFSVLGAFCWLEAQPQSIALAAAPPGGFIMLSAQAQNPFGFAMPCYWVVAHFPIGNSAPSPPSCPPNVGSNAFASWTAVTGATSYDLLRTTTPFLPNTTAAIAVATAIVGTTFTDTFMPLTAYTITSASPANAVFLLDNQNNPQPQVRLTISNGTGTTSSVL